MKAFTHPDPDLGLPNAKHLAGLLDKAHPGAVPARWRCGTGCLVFWFHEREPIRRSIRAE